MNKDDKDALLAIGSLVLVGWLLSRKRGKCSRCNYPVTDRNQQCPNCGQWLNWEELK